MNFIFRESAGTRPITPVNPVSLGAPSGATTRLAERAKMYASHNGDARSFRRSQMQNEDGEHDSPFEVDIDESPESTDRGYTQSEPMLRSASRGPVEAIVSPNNRGRPIWEPWNDSEPRSISMASIAPTPGQEVSRARPRGERTQDTVVSGLRIPVLRRAEHGVNMSELRPHTENSPVVEDALEAVRLSADRELLGRMREAAEETRQMADVVEEVRAPSPEAIASIASTVWSDTTVPSTRSSLLREYTRMIRASGNASS